MLRLVDVTIIGGLVAAAVLTMVVPPVLHSVFFRMKYLHGYFVMPGFAAGLPQHLGGGHL